MHTQERVSVGTSACVKITRPTVSAVSLPQLVCVCAWEWHSYIPAFSLGAWNKSWREGGVVNTVILSAEQPVCIISCGKQPRQTGDFQSHSGWPWRVRKPTFPPSLPPIISLPLILTSLCLSAFVLHTRWNTHIHLQKAVRKLHWLILSTALILTRLPVLFNTKTSEVSSTSNWGPSGSQLIYCDCRGRAACQCKNSSCSPLSLLTMDALSSNTAVQLEEAHSPVHIWNCEK